MSSADRRPDITPELRVGALLEAYPELETILVGIAPPFAKLRNWACWARTSWARTSATMLKLL